MGLRLPTALACLLAFGVVVWGLVRLPGIAAALEREGA
jgi:hypothetical protein